MRCYDTFTIPVRGKLQPDSGLRGIYHMLCRIRNVRIVLPFCGPKIKLVGAGRFVFRWVDIPHAKHITLTKKGLED